MFSDIVKNTMQTTTKRFKLIKERQHTITTMLILATLVMFLFNSVQINSVHTMMMQPTLSANEQTSTRTPLRAAPSDIIPTGVPEIYGEDLNFAYDDIDPYDAVKANAAIKKFSNLDKSLTVEGTTLERYITILYKEYGGMSCEFCCGARSIIFENGKPACGCAHSFAMRGLTKYLLLNHPDIDNEEILEEVGKFKILFFPTIHEAKAQVMTDKGMDYNTILLTTNVHRGIEQGKTTGGSMVGGC